MIDGPLLASKPAAYRNSSGYVRRIATAGSADIHDDHLARPRQVRGDLESDDGLSGAALPDELIDEVALCGPPARIKERLGAWKDSPVTTLCASTIQLEVLELLAEECG